MRPADLPPLPDAPGVYLWKAGDEVIYVGKAKRLKARVTSYFHAEGKPARIAQEASGLEFIVTRDEVEALLLEANLIKAHHPRYNVLLKDDKHYPFLKLTNEPFPMLLVTRRVQSDGARYWGPFPDAGAVRRIKRLIDRVFPLRKNSGYPMKRRRFPCLNHAMGRCFAPCVGKADPDRYAEVVHQVEQVLDGRIDALIAQMEARMRQAARETNFELAAEIRDQIQALKAFFQADQQAYALELGDLDFLGFARAGGYAMVQLYQMRGGRILGRANRFVEGVDEAEDAEILEAFLREHYLEATPLPPLVLLPFHVEVEAPLAAFLSQRAGRKVTLRVPQRGEKARLLEFAAKNAQLGLETELKKLERKGDHPALKALAEVLGLSHRPYRIEGFDISNLMGEAVVASIAVFEGGRPKKSEYRRMRIRSLEGHPNDYAAIAEAVYRRFTGSLADKLPVPDLLLIDGGLGQVRAAAQALERAGLSVPLVGLAKREETLVLPSGKRIALPLTHPALQLLIHLRDETHRNGLRYNRKLRTQKHLKSIFDGIPGIGPRRKQVLLEHFSTLEELRKTPPEELARLPGMNRKVAQALLEALERHAASQTGKIAP